MFKEIIEATFGLFYVMTEGLDHDGSAQKTRVSIFLVFIDFGQVLRTITNPQFGWSVESKDMISWVDFVYVVTHLLQQVIPRVVFFVAAVVLIMGALADTFYVAQIFKGGHVKNMLPVKLLRFLVGAIVTTLFTTVLEWVLFPMECLLEVGEYEHKSLSTLLHGEGAECTPLASPEIAVTLPTIIFTAIYIIYSLVTTLLAFEINPLSRNPSAHSTGRVETLWTAVKVAAAILPYLSEFLSSVVVSVVMLALSGLLLYAHLKHMPFHDLSTNVARGGVYGGVFWLCLASLIVSSMDDPDASAHLRQWVLLALLPVLVVLAAVLVHQRQARILNFVHLLRGEFAALNQHNSPPHSSQDGYGRWDVGGMGAELPDMLMSAEDEDVLAKTVFDKFYDLDYERNRAFKTASEALVVARTVLYSRKRSDMLFLQYLIHRALVENPEHEELLIFQFLVQRFINVSEQTQSTHKNRLSKLQSLALTIDNKYLLYAVNRRSNQDFASAHLGKGAVSAINVMEFEGRMERARKAHLDCIVHLKGFWSAVRKSKREEQGDASTATVEEMITRLGEFDKAVSSAGQEYEWLLEKYSGSVSMLNSYAHFCDVVLNDEVEAEKKRKQAEVLESVSVDEEDEEENHKMEQAAASTATSDSESARTVAAKYMQSWSHIIMASEVQSLRTLTNRVRGLMLLLVVLASAGYFFTSFYLFRDVAKKNILLIDKTGLFRAYTVGSCFLLRNQMIAAHHNDTEGVSTNQGKLAGISENLREQHKLNYESVGTDDLREYYNDAEIATVNSLFPNPFRDGDEEWKEQVDSFWTLANDLARRIERASRTTIPEFNNHNYDPVVASPAKMSVSYIVENAVRALVPAFETAVAMYEEHVRGFGQLTSALVYSNASVNALLVVGIAFFVLRALQHVIQTVQYKYISCWLALTLPVEAVKKLHRFYHDQEAAINDLESDGEEKQDRDNDDNSDRNVSSTHPDLPRKPSDPYYDGRRDDRDGYRDSRDPRYHEDVDRPHLRNRERDWPGRGGRGYDDAMEHRGSFRSNGSGSHYNGRGMGYRNRPRDEGEGDYLPYREPPRGAYPDLGRMESSYERGGRHEDGPFGGYNQGHRDTGGYGHREGYRGGGRGWEQPVVGRHFGSVEAEEDEPPRPRGRRHGAGQGVRGEEDELDVEGEEQRRGARRTKSKRRAEEEEQGPEEEQGDGEEGQGARQKRGGTAQKEGKTMLETMGSFLKFNLSFSKNNGEPQSDVLRNRFKAVEVSDETKSTIQHALREKQAWFSRRPVYVASLSLMLGLCLFSILFPARAVDELTNLGPTTNQAGRRRYLTRACVHFSRELILNDGFMRMDKATIHGALAWHLNELRNSNRAVRLGEQLGISKGADWRNQQHNTIMYEVRINGLYSLVLNFYDAVDAVMSTYGVDPEEATAAYAAYLQRPPTEVGPVFNHIELDPDALVTVANDENLQFILAAFAGDLFNGLGATLISFQHETAEILDNVQFESRLLYACYMVLVVVLFYGTLFRKTMLTAEKEAVRARGFVTKLPTYTLEKQETDVIRAFFQSTLDHA